MDRKRTAKGTPRLGRVERREQIVQAATRAFARSGFTATGLDDIAAEAGITRAILYRHFDSKPDLYRVVLDAVCDRLIAETGHPSNAPYTGDAIDGLLRAAAADPHGFRLLFDHAMREPEVGDRMAAFRTAMTHVAETSLGDTIPDPAWAAWAAKLAPIVAIQAVIAWLDADRPDPDTAADRVREVLGAVIDAAGGVTSG